MSFFAIKLLLAVAIFIVTLSAAWYPFARRIITQTYMDFPIGEALACGVFLGAGLLHMLADASRGFLEAGIDYPFAFLLAGIMFLFLLWLEHLGRDYYAHDGKQSSAFALLAFFMLSIHAFLAGVALGISNNFTIILMIAVAILAHKWAESFALAIQFNKSALAPKVGILVYLLFAVMTPLGIFIGNIASEKMQQYPLLTPIFIALAAGTFLYLGTLHGLSRAVMVKQCCHLKHYTFVILGFSLMAVVAVWT